MKKVLIIIAFSILFACNAIAADKFAPWRDAVNIEVDFLSAQVLYQEALIKINNNHIQTLLFYMELNRALRLRGKMAPEKVKAQAERTKRLAELQEMLEGRSKYFKERKAMYIEHIERGVPYGKKK